MWQTSRKGIAMLFAAVAVCANLTLGLPPGFVDEPVLTGWNEAAGLAFSPVGDHLVVWEKAGRVWLVRNGQRQAAPLLDINDEVNAWRDFGLLGFALDPAFETNGYIYALYTVDHHHLQFFGTPNYNPAANDIFVNTIARLTRFTTREVNGIRTADPASRFVLIGETAQTGFPVCHQSHSIGSLAFAADGTLLVSNGDGASYELADTGGPIPSSSNTALAEGIITPKEDVGAFRAQLVDSLSGKILRIDPATGNGLASNPFYDASAPRAPRSRVWGMGLRNPFRFSIKPGTGGTNPAAGMPGELWIGDVGWADFEELNRAPTGGLNFGWPLFEGLTPGFGYPQSNAVNLDAPNPLNGVGGCTIPAFRFRDLLVQDTLAAPSWPNPCNPLVQIPASVRRFEHTRPVLDWRHGSAGPARVPTYTGNNASQSTLGTPGCPVSGPSFGGNSVTGGVWYTATSFPPEYSAWRATAACLTQCYSAEWHPCERGHERAALLVLVCDHGPDWGGSRAGGADVDARHNRDDRGHAGEYGQRRRSPDGERGQCATGMGATAANPADRAMGPGRRRVARYGTRDDRRGGGGLFGRGAGAFAE